jgi:4-hydroxyacetophenone monooxygenase
MEPRIDKHDDWYQSSQAELKRLVWSSPAIKHSFFKNADGDIHILSPWRLVDYWTWTREPEMNDFILR